MDTNRKVEIYMDKSYTAWVERQNLDHREIEDKIAVLDGLFPYMRTMDFNNDF